jgi:hypothetical protein
MSTETIEEGRGQSVLGSYLIYQNGAVSYNQMTDGIRGEWGGGHRDSFDV